MNEFERQERRARARVSPSALIASALISGVIVFLVPGGGPWTSNETGIAVMGRVMTPSWITALFYQSLLALVYGGVIAVLTFRLTLFMGIIAGAALSLPLYGVNFMFVRPLSAAPPNEVHVVLSHIFFALIFTAQYRAMAVPSVKELNRHHPQPPAH